MVETNFKQTDLGKIPKDWDIAVLQDNITLKARIGWQGLTTAEYRENGDYYLITGTDFKNGYIDWKNCVFVDKIRYDQDRNIQVKEKDILVTKDGTIGKVAYIDSISKPTTLNSGVFVLRILNEKLDSRFIYYILMSFYFDNFLKQITAGSTITHLYQKDFVHFNFIVPPLPEQKAIAEVLSDTDHWITSLEDLIAKKRLIKQGAMQKLLTPKEDWEVKIIREIVATPVTDGPHETPFFLDKGIPFLSVNNIVDNKIDWSDLRYISEVDDIRFSKKCKPRRGDILLGKAASVGKIAIVESDYNFNIWSPLALIRIDEISNKYCFYYLQTTDVLNQIKFFTNTSSQGNIGMGDIEKIEIKYPKSLSDQERIATILFDMDTEIETLDQKLTKAKQIKQGLMQELLTGRIRLV